MDPGSTPLAELDPSKIRIIRELSTARASSIFEVGLDGQNSKYVLKLFHNNGDEGYTERGRDLNRFRCELNAYEKLFMSGASTGNFIPKCYGVIKELDPAAFYPALQHFAHDDFKPSALLLEYIPDAESLNCVNFSETLYPQAIEGIREIRKAGVHHRDVYPKNVLLVRGNPDRLVWIDFDVSSTFTELGPKELAHSAHEVELVESFGDLLKRDQDEGLPPNTKFY